MKRDAHTGPNSLRIASEAMWIGSGIAAIATAVLGLFGIYASLAASFGPRVVAVRGLIVATIATVVAGLVIAAAGFWFQRQNRRAAVERLKGERDRQGPKAA